MMAENLVDLRKSNKLNLSYLAVCLIWLVFVLLIAAVTIKFGFISFETNDDPFLNLFASGALGRKYATNVFNNIVLGWILTGLYSVSSAHNWFTIIELLLYFAGLIVLGISNIRRSGAIKGFLTNLIVAGASAFTMLAHMNFSKTGVFAMLVGLFLLGASADGDYYGRFERRFFEVSGVFFVVIGGLFRIDSVYALLPFVVLMLVYLVVKNGKDFLPRIMPFILAFLIVILAWVGNYLVYNSNSDWKMYNEYNKARSTVLDYGVPDFDEHREEYSALGLSQNDVAMLGCWEIADMDVFTADKLNKIAEIRKNDEAASLIFDRMRGLLVSFVKTIIANRSIWALFALVLVLCFFADKKYLIFSLLSTALGIGEIAGLVLVNRAIERSIFIAIISALVLVTFFSVGAGQKSNRKELACFGIIALCTAGASAYLLTGQAGNVYDNTVPNSFFTYCEAHPDCLFVYELTIEEDFMMNCYAPLDAVNDVSRKNAVMKGGWPIPSPVYTNLLEPFGDKYNMYIILAENRLAYWVTAPGVMKDIFVEYMQAHYDVLPTVVDTAPGGYEVISFSE